MQRSIVYLIFSLSISLNALYTYAQEINFGVDYFQYSISIYQENAGTLDFGTLLTNDGLVDIDLLSPDIAVFSIEGNKFLDVRVTVFSPGYIYLNGDTNCSDDTCRIPLQVFGAYANRGVDNVNQSIIMTGSPNNVTARFPIRYRGNAPPGPPPTPVYQGYQPDAAQFLETAYLYIYGNITVGVHNVGSYSSDVNITLNYE